MSWLSNALNLFIVCSCIYLVLELYARRGERKLLIEKIQEIGSIDINRILAPYFPRFGRQEPSSVRSYLGLRIGIVCLFLGLGVFAGFGLELWIHQYFGGTTLEDFTIGYSRFSSTIYPATFFIFGGLGFLVSAFVERRLRKLDREEEMAEEERKQKQQ